MQLRFAIATIALAAVLAACGGTDVSNSDANPNLPDSASACVDPPPLVCDFFLSCGCDTVGGEKCSLVADVPACTGSGAAMAGDTCTVDSDCEPGTLCADDSGDLRCMTYCDQAHDCPTGNACFIEVGNQLAEVCGQTCSLLGQDCSIASQGCYPAQVVVPEMERGICVTAGTAVQNEACNLGENCAEGFFCVLPQGQTVPICAEMCDRDAPNCASGSCVALIGHTRTGVCL